jgi:hypothetical protein
MTRLDAMRHAYAYYRDLKAAVKTADLAFKLAADTGEAITAEHIDAVIEALR